MVQLVFVHGVAAPRDLASYLAIAAKRQTFFERFCFKGSGVSYHNPHWAPHGAPSEGTYKTIPSGKSGTLLAIGDDLHSNGEDPGSIMGATEESLTGKTLVTFAKDDFAGFLNTLAIAAIDGGHNISDENLNLAEQIADYFSARDNGSETGVAQPSWLENIHNDQQLMDKISSEIQGDIDIQTLGLGSALKKIGGKIAGSAVDLVDGPIAKKIRKLTPKVAVFLGDAFAYIKNEDRRPIIRELVRNDIVKAATAAKTQNQPLILAGHSMGANILVDILFDPNGIAEIEAQLGFPLKVDLLLTVGTQVGLFEELLLFKTSQAGTKMSRPNCVARWWHVFNHMDILSFTVKEVMNGAEEFRVNTKANIFNAHGAYFVSSIFHKRLRKRLKAAGII